MKSAVASLASFAALLVGRHGGGRPASFARPTGRRSVTVDVDKNGAPRYAVARNGVEVMPAGLLGLRFQSQPAMDDGFRVAGTVDLEPRRDLGAAVGRTALRARPPPRAALSISSRPRAWRAGSACGCACSTTASASATKCRSSPATTAREHHRRTHRVPARRREEADHRRGGFPAAAGTATNTCTTRTPLDDVPMAHTPMTVRLSDGRAPELPRGGAGRLRGLRARPATARHLPHQPHALVRRHPRQDAHAVQDAVAHGADRAERGGAAELEPDPEPERAERARRRVVGRARQVRRHLVGDAHQPGHVEHPARSTAPRRPRRSATSTSPRANGFEGVLVEGWNVGWDGDWFYNGKLFSFTRAEPGLRPEGGHRLRAQQGRAPRRPSRDLGATWATTSRRCPRRSRCTSRWACGRSRPATWPTRATSVASTSTASSCTNGTTASSRSIITCACCARRRSTRSASTRTSR